MYATDRRQTKASLKACALWGWRHNNLDELKQKLVEIWSELQ